MYLLQTYKCEKKTLNETSNTLIPKPCSDATKKENYTAISLTNTDTKIISKTLAIWSTTHQKHHSPGKSRIYPWYAGMVQTSKWILAIYQTDNLKDKNYVIISIDIENAFDKIYPIMITTLRKLHTEETFHKHSQCNVWKTIVSITLNGEKF